MTQDSPLFVQSMATGLAVLDVFAAGAGSMNLPEIARAAGISKSAAQRFTYTLERLGLLKKDPITKRFSLSVKTLELGCRYLQSHQLLERANPYLLELNRATGETVNLSEPDGFNMIFIGRFPSSQRSIVHMPVGRALPIFCTAPGRAYLSGLDDRHVREILEGTERPKFTPGTINEIEPLLEQISSCRDSGYACCLEEFYLSDLSLAVPLFDVHGHPIAAVNISVSTAFWSVERALEELVPQLLNTASLISTKQPNPKLLEPFKIGYGTSTSVGR